MYNINNDITSQSEYYVALNNKRITHNNNDKRLILTTNE